jgi:opacity protein-like surface antigen
MYASDMTSGIAFIAVAIVACGTAASVPAHAQAVVPAEVIKQSFAGNTGEIAGARGTLYVYWAPDGTQRMLNQDFRDSGWWRVTPEGEFCGKWSKLRGGAEVCAPVIDIGGGVYQWGDAKYRILLGNAKGL